MALADNLVHYFKCDEASGNLIDAHGGADAVDTGSIGTTTGKIGGARTFDGSTQYATANGASQLGQFTFAGWAYFDSLPASGDIDIILTYFLQGTSEPFGTYDKNLGLFIPSATDVNFAGRIYDGSAKLAISTLALSTATWYFLSLTADGTTLSAKVNASNEGAVSAGDSYTGYADPAMRFGGITGTWSISETSITRANVRLDEWGLWSRALSGAEITSLYNGGAGLSYAAITGGGGGSMFNPYFFRQHIAGMHV